MSRVRTDWALAERVASAAAGFGEPRPGVRPEELEEAADGLLEPVVAYTGLSPRGGLPAPELVARAGWVRANVVTLQAISPLIEERLAGALGTGPLADLGGAFAGRLLAAEAGVALGYAGRRVLGQYDIALLGPQRPARLLFVGPNLALAHRQLAGDDQEVRRASFLRWVALHELTHAVQFAAVPWLRPHLGGLIEDLIRSATPRLDLAGLWEAAGRLVPPDPRRAVAAIRDADLLSLFAAPRERELLAKIQATMAVIEGYAEHVMDAAGLRLDAALERLRSRLERRRSQVHPLEAILARLFGLDRKLRQYRIGRGFAEEVSGRVGIAGLNAVWASPEALPSLTELEHPAQWLDRVGPAARSAAAGA